MTYSFRTNGNFIDFVHTDDTSLAVESVLRSLHNTSRCVTWSLPEDTTRISFVVDDIRVDNFPITEIDFDGVACDSQDDFETGITAAFPGGGGGGGVQSVSAGTNVTVTGTATNPIINATGGASYLVYVAFLSQTGTDAPVVTEMQNTIGEITSAYISPGIYQLQKTGAFPINKTWSIINDNSEDETVTETIHRNSDNAIQIKVIVSGTPTDNWLGDTAIEIRVYP